ncbi:aldehyde dehydrogenase family protein [Frigidibacter oleivorans]|uniref:aldehyde dehydrogenase family protein n=1 Tax=Frigidibacter oleivorans TaxID=2487129 RepID=UPI000F8DF767|nr:aldehyde dehydrogenase family protein [Frigidibacter oleivorans]
MGQIEGRLLIDGALVESESGRWEPSLNPANEEVIGRAALGSAADMDRAIDAARRAWPDWAARDVDERAEILRQFGDRLAERFDELARIEVLDSGNTLKPTLHAMDETLKTLRFYAGLAPAMRGETIPASHRNLHMTLLEPYGVVGRIAAYNHPALFSVARTAAALAVGNAVVVKPPETSPLSALVLGEVAREVLPPGVFNIVNGTGPEAGAALVRHPDVKRLALIGSVPTGRAIQRAAAEVAVKHVTLELGGKNPMIVFPDADPDKAAASAVRGMNFAWQGQSCGSNSRVLVHRDIYEDVLRRISDRVAALRLGDPMAPDTDMGPINNARSHAHVMSFLDAEQTRGARLMTGGKRPAGAAFAKGYWVEPTVYGDVTPAMRLWREEIFGPVMAVAPWDDYGAMIADANDTSYGLSAAIWTNDITTALATARRLRAGSIFVNGSNTHFVGMPWGGFKNSGVDREEGIEEMRSYLETKALNILL